MSPSKEEAVYAPVPTSVHVAVKAEPERRRRFQLFRLFGMILLTSILFGAIFDDDVDSDRDMHHLHHHHMRGKSHPTKLPGGGRDWLVNASEGTIHAKHDPSLVLGFDTSFPLVLVKKGSSSQLDFGPPPRNERDVRFFRGSGLGVVTGEKEHVGKYHFRNIKLDSIDSDNVALVSYQQDKFIVLESSPSISEKHKMALDVANWNIVPGQGLNFVEGPDWDTFKSTGGGRDFCWNEDGSITTKLNPSLVLGQASPRMILVQEDSPQKLVLEHAKELANGKTVPMTLMHGYGAVSKRYDGAKQYGPWHYIESQVVMDPRIDRDPVSIHYDGNFIFVDRENLALDVAFWDMEPGTPVNFVGGDDTSEKDKQVEAKPLLRTTTISSESSSFSSSSGSSESSSSSSSSESSESSSSSSGSESGESSSSSSSGSSESISDIEQEDFEDVVLLAPVKEERMKRLGGD